MLGKGHRAAPARDKVATMNIINLPMKETSEFPITNCMLCCLLVGLLPLQSITLPLSSLPFDKFVA